MHHAQYEKARWNLKFGLLVHAKFAFYHDKMLCSAKLLHGMKCQCSSWRLLKLTLLREADDTSRVVFTHESSIESVFMFCLVDTYNISKCLKYNKGGLSLMTQILFVQTKIWWMKWIVSLEPHLGSQIKKQQQRKRMVPIQSFRIQYLQDDSRPDHWGYLFLQG